MNTDIKISPQNMLKWSYMEDWVSGTSSAPTEHTLTGSGASVARESTVVKHGTYSSKVTRSGNDVTLYHDHPDYVDYQGRKMSFGCWVYCSTASTARIAISDGVGSTNSSYHTGGGSWEFLEVTHDMDGSASRLRVEMHVNSNNTFAYFDGGTLVLGPDLFMTFTDNADVKAWKEQRKYKSQSFNVARRDGTKRSNLNLDDLMVKISIGVFGATPTAAQTQSDAILKAVSSYRFNPDGDVQYKDLFVKNDRFVRCILGQSLNSEFDSALRFIPMDFSFYAKDPYYLGINWNRTRTTVDSSPKTATVTVNGTAYSRPVIKVTAGSADITALTIENLTTGEVFSFSGTITSGEILEVDTDNVTVKNDGVESIEDFTGDALMRITPGDNEFKFTVTGGSTDSVIDVDWVDRWI